MAGERITKGERQATAVEVALKRLQTLYDQKGPLAMYNHKTREDVASVLEHLPEKTAEGVWERLKATGIEIAGLDTVYEKKTNGGTYPENVFGEMGVVLNEPLLTRREEVDLSIRVRRGLRAGENDEEAEDELVHRNLKLVLSVANDLQGKGLEMEDLFQEGNIGLQKAIRKFDWRRGFKLSTYAVWWIRQEMTRAIVEKADLIRHPNDFIGKVTKMLRAKKFLQQEVGLEEPSDADIANLMEISVRDLEDIKANWRKDPASLDEALNNSDEDTTLGEMIVDPSPGPEGTYDAKEEERKQKQLIGELLKLLTDRERETLLVMYASNPNRTLTLEDVGNSINGKITRERVRQLKRNALSRMRNAQKNSPVVEEEFPDF